MKNVFIVALAVLASCTDAVKTDKESVATDTVETIADIKSPIKDTIVKNESSVEAIRAAVQAINQQTLQVQDFKWKESSCADVGTIRYYLDGEEIKKVIETGFIGDGGWTKEYYYNKGKFIFSFEQYIGGPAGLPADTNEVRIYMNADTLILQRKNSENIENASKKLTANSREYRILRALKTKDFGAALCN